MNRTLAGLLLVCLTLGCQPPGEVRLKPGYDDAAHAQQSTYQAMQEKLRQPIECDFVDLPLLSVAKRLSDQAEIEVHLDRHSLAEVDIAVDAKVTLQLHNVPLVTALRLLRKLPSMDDELGFAIDGERLLLTSQDRVEDEELAHVVFYPCGDLIGNDPNWEPAADNLTNAVFEGIDIESWEELGGPGFIRVQNQGLVVTHTADHHLQVATLIDALHQAQSLSSSRYDPAPIVVGVDVAAENEARQAFRSKDLELICFRETPLIDVLRMLCDHCQVQLFIDEPGLLREGVDLERPITDEWVRATAETILRDVLDSVELTCRLHGGVLEITSADRLKWQLVTKVYPVRDLLPPAEVDAIQVDSPGAVQPAGQFFGDCTNQSAEHPADRRFELLLQVLTSSVDPSSWEMFGGNGTCTSVWGADALVIAQTPQTHEKIAGYLAALRRHGRPLPLLPPKPKGQGQGYPASPPN